MMQASQANWRRVGQRSIDTLADEGRTILRMTTVQYETRRNGEHIFWVSRHGAHSIRIDANRPGVYRWMISRDGRSAASGVAVGPLPFPCHQVEYSGPTASRGVGFSRLRLARVDGCT
jgi:hypothetical protein